MLRVDRAMRNIERIVAYASLLATGIGLFEKAIHYGAILRRKYHKRRHPDRFGFHPSSSGRKSHGRSK